ncbi:MAG: hypothetical protein Q8R04_07585 [Nanoarchaeota archaeon]|nr:hypothetical protein [Nanoarchaeota archaeon]
MIKVKRFFSLLIVIFLILSNVAFAQYYSSSGPGPGYYEGRPIDPSKEGKEYYKEGAVVVYPAQINSEEKRMMERFAKGDISEEEMRRMAKSKSGESFDEMKFKRGMLEFKERMERKEAFSYEHEGYGQRYYVGPSYEGYSKEHMVFGMIFQHIGDEIDIREIKQNCNEPEKIADTVISKLKEKVGDLQKLCSQAEEQEAKCLEHSKKGCAQLGAPYVREDATELEKLHSVAYSCPVNKDAIIKACILRSKSSIEQNIRHATESCEKRFEYEGERLLRECERFKENQICDREKHIERCMGGIKKEDFERKCPEHPMPKCEGMSIKSKTDNNDCVYYYCEAIQSTCPPASIPQCGERQSLQKKIDEKGCVYYYCETTVSECPPSTAPACGEGHVLQKKSDEKGCVSYYCEATRICPEPTTPACSAGQTLQKKTDEKGCVYYYCEGPACPVVEKPTCAEGQSITTKYDESRCITGYECVSITPTSNNSITGQVVLSTYDDYLRHCENSWREQERACASMLESCDKDALIEKCKQQSRKNYEDYLSKVEQHCNSYIDTEIRAAEDRCSRMDKERQRCFDESTKRCEHMEGVAQQCRETLTEENLRKFMIDEAKKRCKFTDIVSDEEDIRKSDKVEIVLAVLNTASEEDIEKLELFVDGLKEDLKLQDTTVYKGVINPNNFGDIKLLPFVVNAKLSAVPSSERAKEVKAKIVARQKVKEAAGKLASLRDSDVPPEYLYIIEDKASEVLDVSDELEDIEKKEEEKGFGYKIRLFLGLAKKAEEIEIKQLGESKDKLKNSIETLTKLIDEVPSDVAKAILKEQVENLKQQQEDIEVLIETKEKKAKGLLGLFG